MPSPSPRASRPPLTALQSSGVAVSDECINAYQDLMKRKLKYVVYGLNPKVTEIVTLSTSTEADYDNFLKEFPNNECRWAVYDFEYEVEDGGKRNKVVFYYWCVGSCLG